MDLKIIAVYCICDDVLNILNIKDNQQCLISSAEVMTVGIVSALFYGGNIVAAREFLKIGNYIPNILSHSRLHRRLLAIPQELWNAVFSILRETLHYLFPSTEFAVDSCPVLACQPCRSWRCKLYQGKQYLGYCAAKKLHYYGLKIHLIVSEHGILMEFLITPASCADISGLKCMEIDLPEQSILYGDRAYSSKSFEEELQELEISLIPQRKWASKHQHSGHLRFLLSRRRKVVETVFSQIAKLMPRSFSVRTAKGLQARILWIILACAFNRFVNLTA